MFLWFNKFANILKPKLDFLPKNLNSNTKIKHVKSSKQTFTSGNVFVIISKFLMKIFCSLVVGSRPGPKNHRIPPRAPVTCYLAVSVTPIAVIRIPPRAPVTCYLAVIPIAVIRIPPHAPVTCYLAVLPIAVVTSAARQRCGLISPATQVLPAFLKRQC